MTNVVNEGGYDGATKLQSASAQLGIRIATGLPPAIMIALRLLFLSKYLIGKDKEDEIETEMLERLSA